MRTILTLLIGTALLLTAALIAGCGGDESTTADGGEGVTVVATTSQAADLTRNVVGDEGGVVQVLSANADAHDYEPQPSDAEAMIDADLVIQSGGDLDEWLDEIVESSGTGAPLLTLIDGVETIEGEHGHEAEGEEQAEEEEHAEESEVEADPHWWQSPANAILAVEQIRDELVAIDADQAGTFEANADSFIAELEELDDAIAACIEQVPAEQRMLVTSHDALGYFADRYDVEAIGAVIPALTTQAQASAGETADLVAVIEETGVSTIFPEAGVNASLEQAIADEAGAEVGGELWADTLGPEDSDGATYIEAMQANTTKMVEGFTNGESDCDFGASSKSS